MLQSECVCLVHQTVNIVVFFTKNTHQKGEHPCKLTELFLKRKEGICDYEMT